MTHAPAPKGHANAKCPAAVFFFCFFFFSGRHHAAYA